MVHSRLIVQSWRCNHFLPRSSHLLLSILVIIAIIIFYEIIISILVIIAVIYILLCYHHYLSNFLWDWDGPRFGYSDPVLFWPLVIKLEIFHIKTKLRSNSQFRSASQSTNLFRNLQQYPAPFSSVRTVSSIFPSWPVFIFPGLPWRSHFSRGASGLAS